MRVRKASADGDVCQEPGNGDTSSQAASGGGQELLMQGVQYGRLAPVPVLIARGWTHRGFREAQPETGEKPCDSRGAAAVHSGDDYGATRRIKGGTVRARTDAGVGPFVSRSHIRRIEG